MNAVHYTFVLCQVIPSVVLATQPSSPKSRATSPSFVDAQEGQPPPTVLQVFHKARHPSPPFTPLQRRFNNRPIRFSPPAALPSFEDVLPARYGNTRSASALLQSIIESPTATETTTSATVGQIGGNGGLVRRIPLSSSPSTHVIRRFDQHLSVVLVDTPADAASAQRRSTDALRMRSTEQQPSPSDAHRTNNDTSFSFDSPSAAASNKNDGVMVEEPDEDRKIVAELKSRIKKNPNYLDKLVSTLREVRHRFHNFRDKWGPKFKHLDHSWRQYPAIVARASKLFQPPARADRPSAMSESGIGRQTASVDLMDDSSMFTDISNPNMMQNMVDLQHTQPSFFETTTPMVWFPEEPVSTTSETTAATATTIAVATTTATAATTTTRKTTSTSKTPATTTRLATLPLATTTITATIVGASDDDYFLPMTTTATPLPTSSTTPSIVPAARQKMQSVATSAESDRRGFLDAPEWRRMSFTSSPIQLNSEFTLQPRQPSKATSPLLELPNMEATTFAAPTPPLFPPRYTVVVTSTAAPTSTSTTRPLPPVITTAERIVAPNTVLKLQKHAEKYNEKMVDRMRRVFQPLPTSTTASPLLMDDGIPQTEDLMNQLASYHLVSPSPSPQSATSFPTQTSDTFLLPPPPPSDEQVLGAVSPVLDRNNNNNNNAEPLWPAVSSVELEDRDHPSPHKHRPGPRTIWPAQDEYLSPDASEDRADEDIGDSSTPAKVIASSTILQSSGSTSKSCNSQEEECDVDAIGPLINVAAPVTEKTPQQQYYWNLSPSPPSPAPLLSYRLGNIPPSSSSSSSSYLSRPLPPPPQHHNYQSVAVFPDWLMVEEASPSPSMAAAVRPMLPRHVTLLPQSSPATTIPPPTLELLTQQLRNEMHEVERRRSLQAVEELLEPSYMRIITEDDVALPILNPPAMGPPYSRFSRVVYPSHTSTSRGGNGNANGIFMTTPSRMHTYQPSTADTVQLLSVTKRPPSLSTAQQIQVLPSAIAQRSGSPPQTMALPSMVNGFDMLPSSPAHQTPRRTDDVFYAPGPLPLYSLAPVDESTSLVPSSTTTTTTTAPTVLPRPRFFAFGRTAPERQMLAKKLQLQQQQKQQMQLGWTGDSWTRKRARGLGLVGTTPFDRPTSTFAMTTRRPLLTIPYRRASGVLTPRARIRQQQQQQQSLLQVQRRPPSPSPMGVARGRAVDARRPIMTQQMPRIHGPTEGLWMRHDQRRSLPELLVHDRHDDYPPSRSKTKLARIAAVKMMDLDQGSANSSVFTVSALICQRLRCSFENDSLCAWRSSVGRATRLTNRYERLLRKRSAGFRPSPRNNLLASPRMQHTLAVIRDYYAEEKTANAMQETSLGGSTKEVEDGAELIVKDPLHGWTVFTGQPSAPGEQLKINRAELFSRENNSRFLAAVVRPQEKAVLTSELPTLSRTLTLSWWYWEAARGVQLVVYCDQHEVWHTEWGVPRGSRHWLPSRATCPPGTTQIRFECMNTGESRGVCGLDDIRPVGDGDCDVADSIERRL